VSVRLRDNWLTILRLGLATLVLCSHSIPLAYGKSAEAEHEWVMLLTRQQATGGDIAVSLFFVISGTLVTRSLLRNQNIRGYLSRRWRRIMPGFIGAYIFSVFVVPLLASRNWADVVVVFTGISLPVHVFMLSTLHIPFIESFDSLPYPRVLNGSAWTLPYEAWCYLLVPILAGLGILSRRSAMLMLWVATLFLLTIMPALSVHWPDPIIYLFGIPELWPRLLACFLGGATIAVCEGRLPHGTPLRWLAASGIVSTAILGQGFVVALSLGATLLLWDALHDTADRPATRSTDLSYGVYLYAFPIQQLIVSQAVGSISAIALTLLALPCTYGMAWLSWRFVEAPALHGIRKQQQKAKAIIVPLRERLGQLHR